MQELSPLREKSANQSQHHRVGAQAKTGCEATAAVRELLLMLGFDV
jgi:hypothetical protein